MQFKPKNIINKKEYVQSDDRKFHKLLDKILRFSAKDRPSIIKILEDDYFEEFYSNDIV